MKPLLVALLAAGMYAGPALAQEDPDQSFTPGPPPAIASPIRSTPIRGTDASPSPAGDRGPLTVEAIGDVLAIDELDGTWVGTWTRRPGSNVFDAVWHNRQGQEARDIIRLVGVSNGQVSFKRDGVSGPPGTYSGRLAADGRTIVGAASWYQSGWVWKATIAGRTVQAGSIQGQTYHGSNEDRHGTDGQSGLSESTSQEAALYDNWNTGGCGYTDIATLDLSASVRLTRVSLWYHWDTGESQVRYSLTESGREVGAGALVRGSCDPYQSSWCEAKDTVNVELGVGRYSFRLERAHLCQNAGSGGVGFIKAWGVRSHPY